MLMCTHDTPAPNMPKPNSHPRSNARRGLTANQLANKTARLRTATALNEYGANANGIASPANSAARSAQRLST